MERNNGFRLAGTMIAGRVCKWNSHEFTVSRAAEFFRDEFPSIWKLVHTKHYDAPGYFTPLSLPVTFASGITDLAYKPTHASTAVALSATVCARHDFPTYFVSRELFAALQHTSAPDMKWSELQLPYDGFSFILPDGALMEADTGKNVKNISVSVVKSGEMLTVLGYPDIPVRNHRSYDHIHVCWGVDYCLTIQEVVISSDQKLAPSAEWIEEKTVLYQKDYKYSEHAGEAPPAWFSSYVAGLAANLALLLMARPEMVEKGSRTGKTLKNGTSIYTPNFVGRKYEVKGRQNDTPSGRFTELIWRSGHFKRVHYGHGGLNVKVKFVDPYICYGKGLVSL